MDNDVTPHLPTIPASIPRGAVRPPLIGAYAMAPADARESAAFYEGIAELGPAGLELPLPPSPLPDHGAWDVDPSWDLLMTCIPTVMGHLATTRGYGLASTDEFGRAAALADVARAAAFARRLADRFGRMRVVGIQVHSAPGPRGGSATALARSLEQILSTDLAGASLLVEHCDEQRSDRTAAKGFLSLRQEIDAMISAGGDGPGGHGVAINWGRSAIEGGDAATPVEHVKAARIVGRLGAVIFSGATDSSTPWGNPWGDAHIPPRGEDPALAPSAESLLGHSEIKETLMAAGPACRVVVKVSVRPKDASVATRLAVARASLALVAAAREETR
jgi:hypothetical protein